MKFEDVQRLPLTSLPTSFYQMPNLSKFLGGPDIYVKRDDVMDIAHGGNKTRKLEYVFADVMEKGADTIITVGGIQSNHVRQTVSASAKLGLESHIVLNNPVPERRTQALASGNYLIDKIMGANEYLIEGDDAEVAKKVDALEKELTNDGKKPYFVPLGASNGLGSLGYMYCAKELISQWEELGITPSHIFLGTGSCGTHAGLLLGLRYFGNKTTKVIGISVSQPSEVKRENIRDVLRQIGDVIDVDESLIADDDIIVKDEYYGTAYAYPTDEANQAIMLVGEKEGIILDPVYTGKTMAGLIDMVKNGKLKNPKDIVFLHSGGAPAIHSYADLFLGLNDD